MYLLKAPMLMSW